MARFMGSETEYGISTPSQPGLSPIITSTHLVVSYAAALAASRQGARTRWDFESEHPLRDQRGFDLKRYNTVPVVDPNAVGVANLITHNGARFYVDHAHPEYSAPETSDAFHAMLYDAAGDIIVNEAVAATSALSEAGLSALDGHPPCPPLKIYKHNVDGKGASFGSHENYLYSRSTDFDTMAQALIPFFVARQVITGAGRVGIGARGDSPGFQISQRADYIETEISLETTLNRGIINTRDEPHAQEDEYGRLHVIIGDANMSQVSNFLKFGMTSLVLDAIESGVDFSDLKLADPVRAVGEISRDLTCTLQVPLAHGSQLGALDILRHYWERVTPVTETDNRVHALWSDVRGMLAEDPLSTSHLLDWTAKLQLLRGFRSRGLAWDDPKLALVDLQYCDIDPAKSLYHALVRNNRMDTLVDADAIARAARQPPTESRAYFRGRTMSCFPDSVLAASWDSIVLAINDTQAARIRMDRIDMLDAPATQELFTGDLSPRDVVGALEALQLADVRRIAR